MPDSPFRRLQPCSDVASRNGRPGLRKALFLSCRTAFCAWSAAHSTDTSLSHWTQSSGGTSSLTSATWDSGHLCPCVRWHSLTHEGTRYQPPIPNPHAEDIGRGLLVRIFRQAGIEREEWESL